MISLASLSALYDEHRASFDHPIADVVVRDVTIGPDSPTVMGTLNLSRDSAYRESIATSTATAIRKARVQAAQGAQVVDVGAESSNAGTARVSAGEQIDLMAPVIEAVADEVVVSVETYEPKVVAACLEAGARVLNLTGRAHEEEMLELAAEHGAAVILCFGEAENVREISDLRLEVDAAPYLIDHFGPRLEHARALGVRGLLVDPGMGFFYGNLEDPMPRARHQAKVLAQCFRLRPLGVPVCNAMPHAFDLFEEEFRTAEGFFAVLASLGGTHLFRTHEVPRIRAVLDSMRELTIT